MMIPFIWMITSSFKPENEFTAVPPTLLPKRIYHEKLCGFIYEAGLYGLPQNTLIIVFWSFVGLFLNALAGYAFAKFEFPGNKNCSISCSPR